MAELSLTYRNGMVAATPVAGDDEDESPGRILTVEEFIDRLRDRTDIFGAERNYRLRNTELLTLLIAILAGMLVSSVKAPVKVTSDFFCREPFRPAGAITMRPPIDRDFYKPAEVKRPVAADPEGRRVLKPAKAPVTDKQAVARKDGGVGSIRSRIAKTGILGVLAAAVRGRDVGDGDIFGKGGFTHGIDAVISGTNGLKQGGRTSVARHGPEGIGFGPGYGPSGFGGPGAGGTDDWIGASGPEQVELTKLPDKTGPPVDLLNSRIALDHSGVFGSGGRSKLEVMRVVMQNIAVLRHAYNKRLREKPGLKGKITIRFAIDEFGNVIHCDVVESSMGDGVLEEVVSGKILRWKFEKIDKPGDITEIVYPFVFST